MSAAPRHSARVVLVTGAAGGIGAAVAEAFAARGYAIAITDRCPEGLASVERSLLHQGAEVLALAGDLGDLEFAESVVRGAVARFSRLDALVNNAASRDLTTMRDITPAEWDRTLRVCLTAPAFLARWAAEAMEPAGGGVIVNVGSMMARQAHGVSPAYVSCKGALESLTYDLAALYGPAGIRVVTVAPGAIDTAMSRLGGSEPEAREDDPVRDFSESMAMLGRWGRPEEVARAVAWVASDEASYLTGTTLVLDGGWSRMHMPPQVTRAVLPEAACLATDRRD